jgi:hypothetical protein
MVIGESSRYGRSSLNGYARATNPPLAQVANLVTLLDMITSVSATRLSVPVILSRKSATQSLKDGFPEKSFITAARFEQHKRYVDSYGWADYDNAAMKGDCREVIAKGKPLPRE